MNSIKKNKSQNININNKNFLVNDAVMYFNPEHQLCLLLDINNQSDANELYGLIGEKINISMNNFFIHGNIEQIIHSKDNIYTIIFELGGKYEYGTVYVD